MRSPIAALVATAALVVVASSAALAGARSAPADGEASPQLASAARLADLVGPPRELAQYGHIRSLVRKGGRYELRFDPAFWLGGVTAQRAAVEDRVIGPGEPVPNDYYIRDEGRRVLTYLVPASARVTVLTNPGGIRSTRVTVSELASIVRGKNPRGRPLYDRANGLGYWARIVLDQLRSLDQQYQP